MFTIDGFVADCVSALSEATPALAVRDLVERAAADPAAASVFTPDRCEFGVLHRSDELTVLHLAFPPSLASGRHDHRMWAVVGILDGREDNAFYRRGGDSGLVQSGGRSLAPRDVLVMGDEVIHEIRNPTARYLSALHVYGGDLIGTAREEWDAEGRARPYDHARLLRAVDGMRAAEEELDRPLTADEVAGVMERASR